MQVLQRHNTDHFPPGPSPPKFKLQLPKTTPQTKRGDEVAGVFVCFFLLFFSFSLFWGSRFPLSVPEGFQSMCKKKQNKNKPEYSNPSSVTPHRKHYTACGAQQQEDEICVQSFTDLNCPARLPSTPCNTP